jgi:hypothetical protein
MDGQSPIAARLINRTELSMSNPEPSTARMVDTAFSEKMTL